MITLLREAALKSLDNKNEIALVKSQNIDITNFVCNLEKFKTGFGKNFELASGKESLFKIHNIPEKIHS